MDTRAHEKAELTSVEMAGTAQEPSSRESASFGSKCFWGRGRSRLELAKGQSQDPLLHRVWDGPYRFFPRDDYGAHLFLRFSLRPRQPLASLRAVLESLPWLLVWLQ